MGIRDNLVTTILVFLIIAIFGVTTYFCLDVFNIIDIPEEYSLAKLLCSTTTSVSVAEPIEQIIDEDNIDEWINQKDLDTKNIPSSSTENIVTQENTIDYNVYNIYTQNTTAKQPTQEIKSSNVVNRMYYSQLDLYGRMIYDEINNNKDRLKSGTFVADFDTRFNDLLHQENGSEILEKAFQFSVNAVLFDNPEIFYIDVTKMYMTTEVTTFGPIKTYRVKIGPLEGKTYLSEFFHNEEIVNIATQELEKIKDDVKLRLYGNEYNQIKVVHDYIVENTKYDQTLSNSNIYTAYGCLAGHLAVCEGYAKAFKYILDDLGIPCVIVCGIAQNSEGEAESHAWNYVRLEDNWYAIDATWDDPIIVGSGTVSSSIHTRYFLKGSIDFFKDHQENGKIVEGSNFIYPTISQENYR